MKQIWSFLIVFACSALSAAEWHYPLYLDGGTPHLTRRRVEVTNTSKNSAEGEILRIPVRELGLAGTPSREIRVVDSAGFELLYALRPAAETVAEDAELLVPVKAGAGKTTSLWVYAGNSAAWPVPDELTVPETDFTDSFEEGSGRLPPGWSENSTDALHRNFRSGSVARGGGKSLETRLEPGAKPNWVKFFRTLPVRPGSRYTVRGWVKGENIKGGLGAGYFLHIGPRDNETRAPQNKWGNYGTFDWKQIEFRGTVPEDADSMTFGTVLHAEAGRAWFDDIEIKLEAPEELSCRVGAEERLELRTPEPPAAWELPAAEWPERYSFPVYNLTGEMKTRQLCSFPVNRLTRAGYPASAFRLMVGGRPVPFLMIGGALFFELPPVPPRSALQCTLYLAKERRNRAAEVRLAQASSILSDLESSGADVDRQSYERLLNSKANLAVNPSFESDAGWRGSGERAGNRTRVTSIVPGGIFGKRKALLDIPETAPRDWYGFRQAVPAQFGRTYLVAGWLESDGPATVWAHEYAEGDPKAYNNEAAAVPGSGWRPFAMYVTARHPQSILEVHLTSNSGKRAYDGILVAEILPVSAAKFESSAGRIPEQALRVGQVSPVVKIFPDTVPAEGKPPAVSLARNEAEGLQLAVRSGRASPELAVTASAPRSAEGAVLPAPEINVIGYVKIDAESRYFQFTGTPAYRRCVPAGAFGEFYPDPLLPKSELRLEPESTQGLYLRVSAPADAAPGVYRGEIRFRADGKTVKRLPYEVKVWNFALPAHPELTAIFDDRHGTGRKFKEYTPMEAAGFLATRRISLDEIPAKPEFRLENGEVKADFTEFDRAAERWFGEWNIPRAYLPVFREHFGWGHPPKSFLGVPPYEGKWPFPGVDRGKFTPEYRRVCQAALKLTMDHLREKGWQERFLLYIADEPHSSVPGIKEQMIALCDMFHEVEPGIKIYASTWGMVPEWVGRLDVWGIGVQGQISEENLELLRNSGAELLITTDGQMCLDTPYCALERMLPLYAWKYGTAGYEFWGADWLTRNPFEWGIHTVHTQSEVPGQPLRVRYPNGDGYIFYPGNLVGINGPVSSVRLESLRDGIEDYSYYALLDKLVRETGDREGAKLQEEAKALAPIPNAGGRKSELLLPDPDRLTGLRDRIGEAVSRLSR